MNLNLIKEIFVYLKNSSENKQKFLEYLKKEENNYNKLKEKQKEFFNFKEEFKDKIKDDEDFEKEEKEIENIINELEYKIKKQVLIDENVNVEGIFFEIRPGTGGSEACFFCNDLFRMYSSFAKIMKWKVEMIDSKIDKEGNSTFFSFFINGDDSYFLLKNESGVHRVQRIPETEKKGRIHTSTVSVVVLPKIKKLELEIKEEDLRIDTFRSSGAGGQHVNTTDSAVRITHKPTGIVAFSQDGRSQHSNKEKALIILKSRIFEIEKNKKKAIEGNIRSSAIAGSERSEKIRTYNWPQNRIKDHRLQISWSRLDFFISGNLKLLCEKLIDFEIKKKISS